MRLSFDEDENELMVTSLINFLMNSAGGWTHPLIFLLVVLDAFLFLGFILPGEAPVLVGGVLAGRGALSLWTVGATVAAGAVAGDSCGYWFGRWVGKKRAVAWGQRFGVTGERISRAEKFFEAHGSKAVFAGRFASVFRSVVPFVAGAANMPYRRFVVYNAPAGVLWACVFVGLGFWAGEEWRRVARWVDRTGWIIILVIVAFITFRLIQNRFTR